MAKRDGRKLADWISIAKDALAAKDTKVLGALADEMNGWPILSDLEEFDEEKKMKAFDAEMNRLEMRLDKLNDEGNEDLANELHVIVDMLHAA
jgi:hypothetical protein